MGGTCFAGTTLILKYKHSCKINAYYYALRVTGLIYCTRTDRDILMTVLETQDIFFKNTSTFFCAMTAADCTLGAMITA